MKALIPVAGAGTRLRPHTYTQPKPLMAVAGKPIVSYIIEELVGVGINDFVFVIGYLGEKIKNFIEQNYPNIHTEFVYQEEREGLGHAIWTARQVVADCDEVFIVLGDTIFDVNLNNMLADANSCIGVKKVTDPREFGVVEIGEDGFLSKVIEKPKIPKSNLAIVGLYKIKEVQLLMDCIQYNIENNLRTRGEFQLADGLMRMIERGVKINPIPVNNWFDCGKKEILLETNTMLLNKEGYASYNLPPFENSIIIHPVSIGENCTIVNSIIGPNVTIGQNTHVQYSAITNSIVGSYARIEETVLHHSIIGSDSAIRGPKQSLNIGDNTEMDFS